MILSTHAIVGGAIASFMPGHPVLAFVIGVASHFAIDAIPHVDYPLHSISVKRSAPSALRLNWWLVQNLGLVALAACVGLAIVLWLCCAGALGAMLPDPLQLLLKLYPREALRSLQRFHVWIHTKRRLSWPLGVGSQLALVALVVGLHPYWLSTRGLFDRPHLSSHRLSLLARALATAP
jgi:hypothetical protein